MIPRIRLADSEYSGRPRSPLARGGAARPLEVWIDSASLPSTEDLDHLVGFAHHELVEMYVTQPTEGAQLVELKVANGGATAHIARPSGFEWRHGGPVDNNREAAELWAAEVGFDPVALSASVLLGSVVEGTTPADAFVTGAVVLHEKMSRANAMGVVGALALVGLHLRSADDFTVTAGRSGFRYGRGLFYRILSQDIVPSWGPTWRDLVTGTTKRSTPYLNGLAHALIIRVDQVLRARDRLYFELSLPQGNDAADEAVFAFDTLLLTVDAAFDVLARSLNGVFQVTANDSSARWRAQKHWVRKLVLVAPDLSGIVDADGLLADTTRLVGVLRRSIHSVPHQTVAYSTSFVGDVENLLAIPPDDYAEIREVIERRGGSLAWGWRNKIDKLNLFDLGLFAELTTRLCLQAIEAVIATVIGPDGLRDDVGSWGDTPAVRRQLRTLSGTLDW